MIVKREQLLTNAHVSKYITFMMQNRKETYSQNY